MAIAPNTEAFEREVLIDKSGFREYDARWLYPQQLNLRGAQALGEGLGALIHDLRVRPDIVVGHDYRAYSAAVKQGLIIGLMAAGCRVHDIGLALSPEAYFAQFELDCPAVAMVTASHNENGWTGVKMGAERPLTFGPELMGRLRDIVMKGKFPPRAGGSYRFVPDMKQRYIADLCGGGRIRRALKIVVACGNGTAGVYAPEAFEALGCEVVRLDCAPDYTFPRHNPNPEDMAMLRALSDEVLRTGADAGFAFDGDGDRCGIVDNEGVEIFADKAGVLLARFLAHGEEGARFVADVKSTALFRTDPVLQARGAATEYWKTGHSYIKRRVQETEALAGFEKSGHFFFGAPVGRGYDDGILSAIMVCRMLDAQPHRTLADLRVSLPRTWSSPTMSPHCPDERKYGVVEQVTEMYRQKQARGESIMGSRIAEVMTVNGVRVVLEDGTWGLIRASSNKPALVVVVESPVSETAMHGMFQEMDRALAAFPEVGEYDQRMAA